jgi:hypothetical protein
VTAISARSHASSGAPQSRPDQRRYRPLESGSPRTRNLSICRQIRLNSLRRGWLRIPVAPVGRSSKGSLRSILAFARWSQPRRRSLATLGSPRYERRLSRKFVRISIWAHQGSARPGINGIEGCCLSIRSTNRSDSARGRPSGSNVVACSGAWREMESRSSQHRLQPSSQAGYQI